MELAAVAMLGAGLAVSVIYLLTLPVRHCARKTMPGVASAAGIIDAIRSRLVDRGLMKQADPLVVEGFDTGPEGACQHATVTFTVRHAQGKALVEAAASQRPSTLLWIVALCGLVFYGVPTVAGLAWYLAARATLQRDLERLLDEVAEECRVDAAATSA